MSISNPNPQERQRLIHFMGVADYATRAEVALRNHGFAPEHISPVVRSIMDQARWLSDPPVSSVTTWQNRESAAARRSAELESARLGRQCMGN